jgi:DNA helicase-2/ATP-dependent DNA helicase PcrA
MEASPDRKQEEQKLAEVLGVIDKEIMACGFGPKDLAEFKEIATKDYNARNATVSMFSANKRKAQRLADIRRNPYFGRIDFDDLHDKTSERIYLGAGHIRHQGRDFVHDWRAPVGELFYQSYGGRTTYRAPIGIVPVEIHLKRRLTIQEAVLVSYNDTYDGSDPDPAIADGLLADMLKRHAGTNMGQIVRSIQAEQDAVIRTRGDIVIVQGPAGSGKTVVALHRAAYLLYQMRQSPDDEV